MTRAEKIVSALDAGNFRRCSHNARAAVRVTIEENGTVSEIYLLDDTAEAPEPKSANLCETEDCRNPKQPGRHHCAGGLTKMMRRTA